MIRKQVYIDEDLERALKTLAARTGRPEAEHVRAALHDYVGRHLRLPKANPLLDLIGLVDDPDGPDDVAAEHDHYLYGAPKRRT
ncbi:MAG TPA: CopG family transcriptional regulator [Egibacteraceae bacterium]|nr:CopG family transcriptional regulator [Egibacteraceae bacterium]